MQLLGEMTNLFFLFIKPTGYSLEMCAEDMPGAHPVFRIHCTTWLSGGQWNRESPLLGFSHSLSTSGLALCKLGGHKDLTLTAVKWEIQHHSQCRQIIQVGWTHNP